MNYLSATGLNRFLSKLKVMFATKKVHTVDLTAAGWSLSDGYYYKTASVSGIAANDLLIVSPARGSEETYASNSVMATSQAAGTITFRSSAAVAVTVSVLNLGQV